MPRPSAQLGELRFGDDSEARRLPDVLRHSVESVEPHAAHAAALVPVRSEHHVVDEQLVLTRIEKLRETGPPLGAGTLDGQIGISLVEHVFNVDDRSGRQRPA